MKSQAGWNFSPAANEKWQGQKTSASESNYGFNAILCGQI
jgi:hypothetical protein